MTTKKIEISLAGQIDKTDADHNRTGEFRYDCHYLALDLKTGQPYWDAHKGSIPLAQNSMLIAVAESCLAAQAPEQFRRTAIEVMTKWLIKVSRRLPPAEQLMRGIEEANYHIWRAANEDDQAQLLTASMAVALIEKNTAYIAQFGTAGAFIIRNGRIRRLSNTSASNSPAALPNSFDDDDDPDSADDLESFQLELGSCKSVQAGISAIELQAKDSLLLVTEGILGYLPPSQILQTVVRNILTPICCQQLISAARFAGSPRNIALSLSQYSGDALTTQSVPITAALKYIAPEEESGTVKGKTMELSSLNLPDGETPVDAATSEPGIYRSTIGMVVSNNIGSYQDQETISDGFVTCGAQLVQTEVLWQAQLKEIKKMLDWAQSQNLLNKRLLGSYIKLEIALKKLREARAIFEDAEQEFPFEQG